jgi:hypothetical protein
MSKRYRARNQIGGVFAPRLKEMLESPAYRVLSRAAHQVLARIEIEHLRHGGNDNGTLAVTFDDFVAYGVNRHAIAPAIRELVALGFVEITQQGRAGNAEWRRPTLYRLTCLPTAGVRPTHEWRSVTEDDAMTVAKTARRPPPKNQAKKTNSQCRKARQALVSKSALKPSVEKRTEDPDLPVPKSALLSRYSPSTAPKVPHTPNPEQCPVLGPSRDRPPPNPSPDPDPEAADAWADLGIPQFLRRGSR